MILSAGAYRRLVRFVIQSGHYVNCKLSLCKLELEEDMRQLQVGIENQSALQLVAPQPVSSDYTTYISSSCMVISVGEFRRLVSIVTQSGHSVNCEFSYCTIKLEEDVRQLQLVALQPATADYTTNISLIDMVIPVGEFRRLVSIVTQSGNYVICKLSCCTIEPEEDVRQLQVEMENQSV
ncbi:hypothetical protein MAR_030893, partial [Mya arenaria]